MGYVLITGGCGFIGRHFCDRLISLPENYSILYVDNHVSESSLPPNRWLSSNMLEAIKNRTFEYLYMDIRDFFVLKHYSYRKFDLILHLASIHNSSDPFSTTENLSIDAEFFKFLANTPNKPNKVVYLSSSAVYPICLDKLKETSCPLTITTHSVYGMCKSVGEQLSKIAHDTYGINIVCYRPFCIYGDEFAPMLKLIMAKETLIEVGNESNDYIHVDDVISCVLYTMNSITNGSAINIGSGIETESKHLFKTMCDIVGHKSKIKLLQDSRLNQNHRVADTSYINSLGFIPKVEIHEGINRAIDFMIDAELSKK